MENNVFASLNQRIDFPLAAHICSRCHVIARKIT